MDVVFALTTATVSHEGGQLSVYKGQHWWADDPLVRAYPHLFTRDNRFGMSYTVEPENMFAEPPGEPLQVELASAAPGERRTARRGGP